MSESPKTHKRKDDGTEAFNYFMGGTTSPQLKDLQSDKDRSRKDTPQHHTKKSSSSLASFKMTAYQTQKIQQQQDENTDEEKDVKHSQFYYKLLSLNEKINLFTQLFYNREPRYRHNNGGSPHSKPHEAQRRLSNIPKFNRLKWNENRGQWESSRGNLLQAPESRNFERKKVSFSMAVKSYHEEQQKDNHEEHHQVYQKSPSRLDRRNQDLENITFDFKSMIQNQVSRQINQLHSQSQISRTVNRRRQELYIEENTLRAVKPKQLQQNSSRNEVATKFISHTSNPAVISSLKTNRSLNYEHSRQRFLHALQQESLQEKQLHAILQKSTKQNQSYELRLNELLQKPNVAEQLNQLQQRKKDKTRNRGVKSKMGSQLPQISSGAVYMSRLVASPKVNNSSVESIQQQLEQGGFQNTERKYSSIPRNQDEHYRTDRKRKRVKKLHKIMQQQFVKTAREVYSQSPSKC